MEKRNYMIVCASLGLMCTLLFSCGKETQQDVGRKDDQPVVEPKDTVIYAVGQEIVPDQSHYYAALWRDGKRFYLTDGTSDGFCNAVVSEGDKVYVVGCEATGDLVDDGYYEPYRQNVAVLWEFEARKEETVKRTIMSDGKLATSPLSVSVSDGNVYAAGMVTLESGNRKAVYWTNGKMASLTDGTNDAIAYCVLAVEDDVYIGGYEASGADGASGAAVIWKNGVAQKLTGGNTLAKINALYYENGVLYAAGVEKNKGEHWKGVIWKDGSASYFHTESEATVVDLYVKDGKYIVGGGTKDAKGHYVPCTWTENGVTFASEDVEFCTATAMDVAGDDIYLAGNEYYMDMSDYSEYYTAYLWKNGTEVTLEVSTTDTSIWDVECAFVSRGQNM